MKHLIVSFIVGVLFSIGLVVSGMTMPSKVVGFLDFAGDWDASLVFVMVGGILTNWVIFRWVLKRPQPFLGGRFGIPTRKDLDGRLIAGSALFGLGWGLGGFCPGPALTSIVTGTLPVLVFVGSMLGGMVLFRVFDAALKRRQEPAKVGSTSGEGKQKNQHLSTSGV